MIPNKALQAIGAITRPILNRVRYHIMNICALAILVSALTINFTYSQAPTTANVGLPPGVSCEIDRMGNQSYKWIIEGKHSLFMLGPNRLKPNEDLAWSMATNIESHLKSDFSKFPDVQSFQTKINDVSSGIFSGKELITVRKSKSGFETYHTLYFLWDGSQMWSGHMSGGAPSAGSRPEDYEMVRRILASITNGLSLPISDDALITVE